jgi:hypothetical protein
MTQTNPQTAQAHKGKINDEGRPLRRQHESRLTKGHDTIQIAGGRQALQRSIVISVTKDDRSALVPVPGLLGALVLKAAAWLEDSRDRERHSQDAALLASLISDPIAERRRFRGSDRKRLLKLHTALADPRDL